MGKSKDLASGNSAAYVETAGDSMTGDLGIGVAPAQPLHVFKAGSQGGGMAPLIKVQNDTNNLTGDGSGIEFHGKYQGGEWGFGKIGGTNAGGNFGGSLEFHTNTGTGSVSTGFTKKMTIDRNGYVTMPYQPMFKAGRTSNYTPGVGNYIIFDSVDSAYQHNVGGHYSTSTGRFTAPVAGVYHFGCCILWQGVSDGADMADSFQIRKNGNLSAYSMRRAEYVNGTTGNGGYYSDFCFYDVKLDANDYISIYSQKGNQIHGNQRYTWFYGHLVG